jgi:hypothetical protein
VDEGEAVSDFRIGDTVRWTDEAIQMGVAARGELIGIVRSFGSKKRLLIRWSSKKEFFVNQYWLELTPKEVIYKTVNFGQRLKNWRLSHGYSYRQAAKYLGMDNSCIYRYETNKRANPRKQTIIRVAERMGICPKDFLRCDCK